MAVLRFALFSSIGSAFGFQRTFKGADTVLPMPLTDQLTTLRKMEMKYWTTLKETKDCVLDPYDCTLDEYDTYLEADITLSNVDTTAWVDGQDSIKLMLAFDQTTVPNVNVYDVLTFSYTWDKAKAVADESGGWTCSDGYIPKGATKQDIKPISDVDTAADADADADAETAAVTDHVLVDPEQNCVIDNGNSTVSEYDAETGKASFTVRFRRALITRAIKLDSQLIIGQPVIINYGYKLSNGLEGAALLVEQTDFNDVTSDQSITVLNNSKALLISTMAAVSTLIAYF